MKKLLTPKLHAHVEPPPEDESAKRLQAALEKSDRDAIARELGVPLRYQGLDSEEAACRSFAANGEVLRQQDLDEFAGCLASMTKFDEDCMVFFESDEKAYGVTVHFDYRTGKISEITAHKHERSAVAPAR
jgi:hypothetical protein